jgi:hypothetical protein
MDSLSLERPADTSAPGRAALVRRSLRHHAWLLGFCLTYMALALGVLAQGDHPRHILLASYAFSTAIPPILAVLFIAFGHLCHQALHVRPFSPRGALAAVLTDERLTLKRAIYALIPVLLIPVFASTFTSFKNAIPNIIPFTYDIGLMELDRLLHFGVDPWRLLQPILGYPLLTSVLSYFYNFWFPLMYLVLYWQIFSLGNPRLRMQYLVSFAVIWILAGNLLALALSSAGPCFYDQVTGTVGPYGELMTYLHDANQQFRNWSIEAQSYLWEVYLAGNVELGGGISAMPSLHVAVAVLQALLGWQVSRKLGLLLSAYAAVILLSSVHLGWHYAVDGYFSIALAAAVWFGVGRLLRGPLLNCSPMTTPNNRAF